jgi:serine/threonine protein kinase
MSNTMFLDKVVEYELLDEEEARILSQKCKRLNVSSEIFMLACRIINRDSIKKFNLLVKGCVNLSKQEVRSLFNLDILKREINKIKNNGAKPKEPRGKKVKKEYLPVPQIGDEIDHYEIKELISRSKTSVIYKAYHKFLNTDVALKIFFPETVFSNPLVPEKFWAEAVNNARINHPGIVKTMDAGKKENFTYVVSEYLDCTSMEKIVHNYGPVEPVKAITIIMNICKSLEHCLKLGLLNKNLKPENIVITKSAKIKLLNFGLTPIINQSEKINSAKRKIYDIPYFIAPEQLININKIDFRADMYSLGCILYYFVTGRRPFETNSVASMVSMHLKEKPVSPELITPAVNRELSGLIMKLLEKNSYCRYKNYSSLYNDLKNIAFKYVQNAKAEIIVNNTAG